MTSPKPSSGLSAVRVGPSRVRRWWMTLTAWAGDHLWLSMLGIAVMVGAVLFYGMRLNGFAHLCEALGRWRMEVFGGTFRVERSIEVPDVILSLRKQNYDRVDALSGSSGFMGGTAFRKEIGEIVSRPGAKIRVVAIDPRLAEPGHSHHADFAAAAAGFGLRTWEYAARCRHSAAVLLHLLEDFAQGLEVRLLDAPVAAATSPFLTAGRSVQLYRGNNPAIRLDIIVPSPAADGMDSFSHPGLIIRDRPDDPEVKRFSGNFEDAWSRAKPLDAATRAAILPSLAPAAP